MPHYHLLHTEWSDGWGGQERRIVNEMAGMQARGHQVHLATRAGAQIIAPAQAAGITVTTLPFAGKFDRATISGLVRYIREHRIDLVNTHSGKDSWSGGLAAKWARVRLVRTRHLDLPLRRHPLNFVHYLHDALISCGQLMREHLLAAGFPAQEVVSIPTGIDFERFTPTQSRTQVRAQLGIPPQAPMALMVGVIRSVKRHEIALRAWVQVAAAFPQARLVLAGDGPLREAMIALAGQLGIADQVQFLGHREDVANLIAAADVGLLTSHSEGVPQAITQMLGLGLPVVATAVGGVPELIMAQETGLLVPPEDPFATAQALLTCLQQPHYAQTLARRGQQHVLAHYSLRAMLDQTEALYARLLVGRAA